MKNTNTQLRDEVPYPSLDRAENRQGINVMKLLSPREERSTECRNAAIEWHEAHNEEYEAFRDRVSAFATGDFSLLAEIVAAFPLFTLHHTEAERLYLGIDHASGDVELLELPCEGKTVIELPGADYCWNGLSASAKAVFRSIANSLNLADAKPVARLFRAEVMAQLKHLPLILDRLISWDDGKNSSLLFSIYYFMMIDDGLAVLVDLLDNLLVSSSIDMYSLFSIEAITELAVRQSLYIGTATKTAWLERSTHYCPEIWKSVMIALRNAPAKRGLKAADTSLGDLLRQGCGAAVESVLDDIRRFLQENKEAVSLAYLLEALKRSKCLKESVKYAKFHRAIERFAGQKYGIDMPQRRYGEIAEMTLTEPALSPAFSKAKRTVEHWQQLFTTSLKTPSQPYRAVTMPQQT